MGQCLRFRQLDYVRMQQVIEREPVSDSCPGQRDTASWDGKNKAELRRNYPFAIMNWFISRLRNNYAKQLFLRLLYLRCTGSHKWGEISNP